MLSLHTQSAPTLDTHTPELAALPSAGNVIIDTVLDTSSLYARSLGQAETLRIGAPDCLGTVEPSSGGPVATNNQADCPVEAGSPTRVPAAAHPLSDDTSADLHINQEREAQPQTGIT